MKTITSSIAFLVFAGLLVVSGTSQIAHADSGAVKIIKFEADWCGPCQQMKPEFNAAKSSAPSGVSFQTVNVDSEKSMADRYNVSALPTIVAVKNGTEVSRVVGFKNQRQIESFIKKSQKK